MEAPIGLFSLIGGIFGGNSQKKAASKAADAQIRAAQMGIDETRRQYDQSRADFMPYLNAGTGALSGITQLMGLGGADAQAAAITSLESSPMYASLIRNGEEALLQNASATGGIRGGNTQRGLADFRSDVLGQQVQQQLANLFGLSNMGAGATSNVAGLGAQASGSITNLLGQQGAARAMNYYTRGGINAQNFKSVGSFLEGDDLKGLLASAGKFLF